ncbi:glutaredoxin family protein [Herminiimonas sp. KBW02]|uniref:glutaredoxin family protein n=1 Tax=Herminiimonas sp. KBW02 TaxID=2153363 RepID=UPI000F5ACB48|nr:glutaredoxin family protein [Herminiimonas sp. KBW02]RQO33979.1 glutaredoxin family protein [Herminiimonas sp. KBW02]
MNKRWSWLLLSLLFSVNAHAQLYKWVGQDGKVTYSDTPPPSSVKKVEEKAITAAPVTANLPFELTKAMKAQPVTLYTTNKCNACDSARSLLNTRGIPYAEKTVNSNEDIARLQQVGGDKQLPFLTVGRNKLSAFEAETWNTLLSNAGYPESSLLPASYRNPPVQAAAPKKVAEPQTSAAPAKEAPSDSLPAAGNAPPGFRF